MDRFGSQTVAHHYSELVQLKRAKKRVKAKKRNKMFIRTDFKGKKLAREG